MRTRFSLVSAAALVAIVASHIQLLAEELDMPKPVNPLRTVATATPDKMAGLKTATFGTGCFWCTEAVFEQLNGVKDVVSGYIGGRVKNPTYEQVCSGMTGHAEAVEITYDPSVISFADLLEVFWKTHDPTTLNRQGNDVGTQYRSAVFYRDDEQRELAENYKKKLNDEDAFGAPIVTDITEASEFYPAEKDHQDYYRANPTQGYCSFVIRPKIEKFRKVFAEKLQGERE